MSNANTPCICHNGFYETCSFQTCELPTMFSVSSYHIHTEKIVDYDSFYATEEEAQAYCDKMNDGRCKSNESFIVVSPIIKN